MRYLTLQLNENAEIVITNDMTGKETIYYNGETVSQKRTFWGHKHEFTVNELGSDVDYSVDISFALPMGIGFVIERNGSQVLSNKLETSNSKKGTWWAILLLLVAGFVVGYSAVKGAYLWTLAGITVAFLVTLTGCFSAQAKSE